MNASPRLRAAVLVLALSGRSAGALAGDVNVHWGYDGEASPEHWAELSAAFETCGRGHQQSPVDLPVATSADIAPAAPAQVEVFHHEHVLDISNNGHTVAVTYDDGDRLSLGGTDYQLVQYHFHAPSEHTVGGQHFPLELHLVHRAASGALAVVGVLIEYGAVNPAYAAVVEHLPAAPGGHEHLEHVAVDIDALLPPSRQSFAYAGSLTTPPCTEGVRWLVLRSPVALGAAQIARLGRVLHHNNRPVQALHERALSTTAVEAKTNDNHKAVPHPP